MVGVYQTDNKGVLQLLVKEIPAEGHTWNEQSAEVLARQKQIPQLHHRQEPSDVKSKEHLFFAEDKLSQESQHLGRFRSVEARLRCSLEVWAEGRGTKNHATSS